MNTNKYDVPYHCYRLIFEDGSDRFVDIGCEDDWGDIQGCNPEDCEDWKNSVGFGNDADGHKKIVKVIDLESDLTWEGNNEVKKWAEECVWRFVDNYSEF